MEHSVLKLYFGQINQIYWGKLQRWDGLADWIIWCEFHSLLCLGKVLLIYLIMPVPML